MDPSAALVILALGADPWTYLGELPRPAKLADCPPGAEMAVSLNSGTGMSWQAFCYARRPPGASPERRREDRKKKPGGRGVSD